MPATGSFEFYNPLRIISGKQALENLPIELQWLGASRPFCLWPADTRKKVMGEVIRALKGSAITLTIPDKLPADADSGPWEQLALDFSASACDCLVVIGDQAELEIARRLIPILSGQPREPRLPISIDKPLTESLPVVQLFCGPKETIESLEPPDTDDNRLQEITGFLPSLVVIDSRLLPRIHWLPAVSEALAILSYCAELPTGPFANPVADSYAHAVIRLIMQHIGRLADKDNFSIPRLALANAKILCQCVQANSASGLSQLLGRELARVSRVPLGILTGIVLPYVLEAAARRSPEAVAQLLLPLGGIELFAITAHGLRARKAVNLLHDLLHALFQRSSGRIPATLQQAGLTDELLVQAVNAACSKDPDPGRPASCSEIVKHAWLGHPISI
jgi:alcohol dehydrogenase